MEGKKFIGPLAVAGITKMEDFTTPMGAEVITVLYEGGKSEIMPMKTYEIVLSDTPCDYTELRSKKFKKMLEHTLLLLSEYDIKYSDVGPFASALVGELDNSFNRATNFLWTGEDKEFIAGWEPMNDRTLLESQKVIKTIPHGEENTQN